MPVETEPKPLTSRQAEVLDAYCRLWHEHGRRPTIREWMESLGIHSPNGIMENLRLMQNKGWVRIVGGYKSRGNFRFLRVPADWVLLPGGGIVPWYEVRGLIEKLEQTRKGE